MFSSKNIFSSFVKGPPPKHKILKSFLSLFDKIKALIRFVKFLYLPLAPTNKIYGLSIEFLNCDLLFENSSKFSIPKYVTVTFLLSTL